MNPPGRSEPLPANVYPKDLQRLKKQVAPLKRYAVEIRDGDVWVDIK
jgi:hypothetical protein